MAIEKVLIAAPSYNGKRYCFKQYMEAIEKLDKRDLDVHYLMVDNSTEDGYSALPLSIPYDILKLNGVNRKLGSREVLAYCYSVIMSYAISLEFDYLLLLESDVLMPPNGLKSLISTSKKLDGMVAPVIFREGGRYCQIYKDDLILWKNKGSDGLYRISRTPYKKEEISLHFPVPFRIGSATFSCLLIPCKYLNDLNLIRWSPQHYNHPDVFFYYRNKVPVFCDPGFSCIHLQKPWGKDVIW